MKLRWFLLLTALAGTARGDLLVSGYLSNAVFRYNEITGAQIGTTPFISNSVQHPLSQPHRVFFEADGNLLVANAGRNNVVRYNGQTGAYMNDFISTSLGGLNYPVDITVDSNGLIYVTSQMSDSVLRYNADGTFKDEFVSPNEGGLDGPSGLVFLNGNLFVAGRVSNKIHRYDLNGNPVGDGIFATSQSNVLGLEIGPDNKLYAMTGNSVIRYDPANTGNTGTTVVATGSGGLSGGIGLDFGPNYDLFAASFNSNSVIKYSAGTYSPATFISPASSGGLSGPNFLTFAPVPEPGAAALLVAGMAVLGARRRS